MRAMILALVLAGPCAGAAAAPSLHIATDHPLSADAGGPLAGYPATVRRLVGNAGIPFTVQHYPWKRAYEMARERADVCVFLTSRTPEREALFKWVGPILETEWTLAGRAGRDYGVRTLEDARKYRIGTYLGDVRHEYLSARGFKVDAAQSDSANPRKLLLGRIDLWASATTTDGKSDFAPYYPHAIVPVLKFHRVGQYLACNRAVPDDWIARMNREVAALREDGHGERRAAPPPERPGAP